jgi:hypothetical protein
MAFAPDSTEFIDRDLGFKALRDALSLKAVKVVKVGVDSRPHRPSGIPTDELAAIHEFGQGTTPARPFIRGWVDAHKKEIEERLALVCDRAIHGGLRSWREEMMVFGEWCVAGVQAYIGQEIPPPLLAATLNKKKKGYDPTVPLIDSEQMYRAVIWELDK